MKNKIKLRIHIVISILFFMSINLQAQFQQIPSTTNQSWGFLSTNVSRIGIGNFTTITDLPSTLTVNGNTTLNATSEVFRTYGSSTGLNAWRLLTGTTNPFEMGMIFNYGNNPVVADQTNYSIQASTRDMTFHTRPFNGDSVGTERVRIVGFGKYQGNVGIGTPTPKAKLEVAGGDIAITTIGTGIILKATNGDNYYRITVDNNGKLNTELITKL